MKVNNYLDSTYLKTAEQANISVEETTQRNITLIEDAIQYKMKLVMLRSNYITIAKELIAKNNSEVLIGTVIDFPEGNSSVECKISDAKSAIALGADELDFVINYRAFKKGNLALIKSEILSCIKLCLENNKAIKWIIEIAALSNEEIIVLSQLIKDTVISNFDELSFENVFVKSSTGFFQTENNKPSGATFEAMKLIVENASPLKIKAAGGVKTFEQAKKMISIGVDRIGTSSAKQIILNLKTETDY
ncbi:deoxyribose-phosphate aldolase [Tenacibaculum aquimarinum]|uniref:deoxyribose-phosphate aldolase n=1 Tax=Tenacibaculum aquimarinum TaxID=2910675 RepID=UPI001F0B0E63|nr:deoxyribose-phosphate aldolase [Tenacibaculum aquimarinum]MCH3884054.1 deoxyribose-phosphate aldolase [Tenacibaculum aquimarinum]